MSDSLKHWQPDQTLEADFVGRDGAEGISWHVAEEVPVAFVYGGQNHAVMLASPADLVDFAYGFSFSEGIIDAAEDITKLEIRERKQGIDLLITLSEKRMERFKLRTQRRIIVGSSSCGLCGIDSMEALFQPPKKVADDPAELVYRQVIAAVAEFQQQQPLKKLNRSVHGAAWVSAKGKVKQVREDVGRHNALDKLIGARLQSGAGFESGYCLVSSRGSYEMVLKAVRAGIPALVCLSAPTAFAVRTAKAANLTLVNWAFEGMAVF
jgi:formate dehydrogenase accessory protein FdhD